MQQLGDYCAALDCDRCASPDQDNNINALIHITGRFILDSPWIALAVLGVLLIVFGVTWFVFPLA